ncbi:MAG: ATP-dependent DNA helicase RecQ [Methanocorpusculum sp.]|nr:ATP-dependent DNA helicase RecQ [Methanocorpusculum sp.]
MKKNQTVQATLEKYFHHRNFRPNQEEIINEIVEGHDVLAVMATGGGKSLCYQLPALMLEGMTVVISPLIALMKNQVDLLSSQNVKVETLNSLQTYDERQRIEKEMTEGLVRILYVSPERAVTKAFADVLMKCRVSLFAVDEAHCISMWGHQFRPEYREIKNLREKFPNVPFAAFTATATKRVRDDIVKELKMDSPAEFIGSFDRKNLFYSVYNEVNPDVRTKKIVSFVAANKNVSGIIYCFSRAATEELALRLRSANIIASPYHAGLATPERNRIQDGFINNSIKVVCATVAFGMGIDKPDVRYVIHAHMPKDIESYYQETGRAGRDGLPAQCLLFYSSSDRQKILRMTESEFAGSGRLNIAREKVEQMYGYCISPKCRRHILLSYFGEEKDLCGNCDNCVKKLGAKTVKPKAPSKNPAKDIVSAAKETDGLLTVPEFVSFLLGLEREKTKKSGLTANVYFGAAKGCSRDDLTVEVYELVKKGKIILEGRNIKRVRGRR